MHGGEGEEGGRGWYFAWKITHLAFGPPHALLKQLATASFREYTEKSEVGIPTILTLRSCPQAAQAAFCHLSAISIFINSIFSAGLRQQLRSNLVLGDLVSLAAHPGHMLLELNTGAEHVHIIRVGLWTSCKDSHLQNHDFSLRVQHVLKPSETWRNRIRAFPAIWSWWSSKSSCLNLFGALEPKYHT